MLRSIVPKFAKFAILFLVLVCSACPKKLVGGYEIDDGTVIYHDGMKGIGSMKSYIVEGADAPSFESLNRYYGKDKNHAFFDGKRIPGSEGSSFKLVDGRYTSDRNHVYYSGKTISAAPQTFKILFRLKSKSANTYFSTDGAFIFFEGKTFFPEFVDVDTFERIGRSNYFRDKRRVYTLTRVLEGADPASFRIEKRYSGRFSSDSKHVFYNGVPVIGVDPESHQIIDEFHHRDKNKVYFAMKQLSNDPENFRILSKAYSKDSAAVYWRGRKIGQDPANFVVFPSDRPQAFAKDSTSVYWCSRPVPQADVETFKGLNHNYAADKHRVFYGFNCLNPVREIKEADPDTFALVKGEKGIDARDVNRSYRMGRARKTRNQAVPRNQK